jgi:hypothetical protein
LVEHPKKGGMGRRRKKIRSGGPVTIDGGAMRPVHLNTFASTFNNCTLLLADHNSNISDALIAPNSTMSNDQSNTNGPVAKLSAKGHGELLLDQLIDRLGGPVADDKDLDFDTMASIFSLDDDEP